MDDKTLARIERLLNMGKFIWLALAGLVIAGYSLGVRSFAIDSKIENLERYGSTGLMEHQATQSERETKFTESINLLAISVAELKTEIGLMRHQK